MQPQNAQTDSCCGGERVVREDSCCGGEAADLSFEQRFDLGQQRRVLVRRVALAGSVVLTLAALALVITGGLPVLADRLAWAASIWAVGLVLGWARQVVTARRLDWRLPIAIAALVCGIVWQPLVAALVAVALLAERVLRPPRTDSARTTAAADATVSAPAGQLG